ncbi:hypothetical protein EMIT0P176_130073 [Pseudomonas sp. IT-P176]
MSPNTQRNQALGSGSSDTMSPYPGQCAPQKVRLLKESQTISSVAPIISRATAVSIGDLRDGWFLSVVTSMQ